MIRIFATPTPVEAANIAITAAPEIIIVLENGIVEPGIVQ
jgi:hypothetical protein